MPVSRPLPVDQARVLVVEDDISLRRLLVAATTSWGFTVCSAWSGEDAVRMNEAEPFDLAVLDFHLPRMNGIETLHQLRRHSPHLQSVMLTGFGSVEIARQALRLEVVEFLIKPCNKGELEQAIDRALRRRPTHTPATPDQLASGVGAAPADATLDEVERFHILASLCRNRGNRTATARELGVTRRTLFNKLRRYERQGL